MQSTERKINKGFTLIEIIVAVSIFTIVMLVTMGALLTLNDSSRKAQALRTVIDNLNFAVEDMSRKIRTGDIYRCFPSDLSAGEDFIDEGENLKIARDCPSLGGSAISLKTQEIEPAPPALGGTPVWVAYIFRVNEETGIGSIVQRRAPVGNDNIPDLPIETEAPITSPEVDIDTMEFRVIGTNKNNNPRTQPMVIVNISGTVNLKKERLRTNFSLQTAISRRGTQEAE